MSEYGTHFVKIKKSLFYEALRAKKSWNCQTREDIVLEQIKLLCLEQLPEYVQPVAYKFRESLPLTAVGKIDYIALEKEDENIKNKSSQMVLKKV